MKPTWRCLLLLGLLLSISTHRAAIGNRAASDRAADDGRAAAGECDMADQSSCRVPPDECAVEEPDPADALTATLGTCQTEGPVPTLAPPRPMPVLAADALSVRQGRGEVVCVTVEAGAGGEGRGTTNK